MQSKRALENMYKQDGQTMREKGGRGFRKQSMDGPAATSASIVAAVSGNNGAGVGSTLRSFHLGGASAKIVQSDLEIYQMVMLRALEALESSTIVLDAFESLVTRANQFLAYASGPDESERAKKQLEDLFDVLISLYDLEQCERMRQLLLTSIKLFLFRFSGLIFRSSEQRWTRLWYVFFSLFTQGILSETHVKVLNCVASFLISIVPLSKRCDCWQHP